MGTCMKKLNVGSSSKASVSLLSVKSERPGYDGTWPIV